jgi:hypothetical protein
MQYCFNYTPSEDYLRSSHYSKILFKLKLIYQRLEFVLRNYWHPHCEGKRRLPDDEFSSVQKVIKCLIKEGTDCENTILGELPAN